MRGDRWGTRSWLKVGSLAVCLALTSGCIVDARGGSESEDELASLVLHDIRSSDERWTWKVAGVTIEDQVVLWVYVPLEKGEREYIKDLASRRLQVEDAQAYGSFEVRQWPSSRALAISKLDHLPSAGDRLTVAGPLTLVVPEAWWGETYTDQDGARRGIDLFAQYDRPDGLTGSGTFEARAFDGYDSLGTFLSGDRLKQGGAPQLDRIDPRAIQYRGIPLRYRLFRRLAGPSGVVTDEVGTPIALDTADPSAYGLVADAVITLPGQTPIHLLVEFTELPAYAKSGKDDDVVIAMLSSFGFSLVGTGEP